MKHLPTLRSDSSFAVQFSNLASKTRSDKGSFAVYDKDYRNAWTRGGLAARSGTEFTWSPQLRNSAEWDWVQIFLENKYGGECRHGRTMSFCSVLSFPDFAAYKYQGKVSMNFFNGPFGHQGSVWFSSIWFWFQIENCKSKIHNRDFGCLIPQELKITNLQSELSIFVSKKHKIEKQLSMFWKSKIENWKWSVGGSYFLFLRKRKTKR